MINSVKLGKTRYKLARLLFISKLDILLGKKNLGKTR